MKAYPLEAARTLRAEELEEAKRALAAAIQRVGEAEAVLERAQQRREDFEILFHVQGGTIVGHAERILDHDLVREPDAEHEAVTAGRSGGHRLLRYRGRVTRIGRRDRRTDFDGA